MTMTIRAHFDGKVILPDEPPLRCQIQDRLPNMRQIGLRDQPLRLIEEETNVRSHRGAIAPHQGKPLQSRGAQSFPLGLPFLLSRLQLGAQRHEITDLGDDAPLLR